MLLFETPILHILHEYGTVAIHGSYGLDLMTWREIDFYLGVDNLSMQTAFSVVTSLSHKLPIRDLHVINQVDFEPRYSESNMIIMDLYTQYKSQEWKLDIGIIPFESIASAMMYNNDLRRRLTKTMKHSILEIKASCMNSKRYRK